VVENHATVAAVDKEVGSRRQTVFGWERLRLENARDVVVPMCGMRLASCQMAIDKTQRAIVQNKP
jgi:hypothetical protein